MKKRVFAAVLWTYVTWYACNVFGAYAGLTLPGVAIGLLAGVVVLGLPIMRGQTAPTGVQAASPVAIEG